MNRFFKDLMGNRQPKQVAKGCLFFLVGFVIVYWLLGFL